MPYDAIAIYIQRGEELVPEHANYDNFRLFSSLRIPIRQGLSGWVAHSKKPIINGNPSLNGIFKRPHQVQYLRSALAVPLEGGGIDRSARALSRRNRRIHIRSLAHSSGNQLEDGTSHRKRFEVEQAENSAANLAIAPARSPLRQPGGYLGLIPTTGLAVMVCDMDGFKQINARFGHLEGNRVLRLFAQALKHSCRDYDYVARMGGDEFVVVAPGLSVDSANKKVHQLRELAQQAGREVCGEDILSLSTGFAHYPTDGADAEALLAEADRRMYAEKQRQPFRKNRRLYPRMKCRVTIELRPQDGEVPVLGNLIDVSLGGCYVETSALMPAGSVVKVIFSIDDGRLQAAGSVVRTDPGSGIAIRFNDMNREDREKMHKVLEFVHNSTMFYDNRYFSKLLKQ